MYASNAVDHAQIGNIYRRTVIADAQSNGRCIPQDRALVQHLQATGGSCKDGIRTDRDDRPSRANEKIQDDSIKNIGVVVSGRHLETLPRTINRLVPDPVIASPPETTIWPLWQQTQTRYSLKTSLWYPEL